MRSVPCSYVFHAVVLIRTIRHHAACDRPEACRSRLSRAPIASWDVGSVTVLYTPPWADAPLAALSAMATINDVLSRLVRQGVIAGFERPSGSNALMTHVIVMARRLPTDRDAVERVRQRVTRELQAQMPGR